MFQIVRHKFDDLAQRHGLAGQVAARTNALPVTGGTDTLVLKLSGDLVGDGRAQVAPNDLQEQIHRRRATGGRVALSIDLVDVACAFDIGKFFLEARTVFPVDGAAMAFELTRFGQYVTAKRESAK